MNAGGGIGAAPVAGEDVRAAHEQLAVVDAHRDAGQREADRSGAALADVRIAQRHERLGHPVALEDGVAEELAEAFEDVRRQRRGAGDEEAHALADLARGVRRRVEQADVDRRHAEEERRTEIAELIERGAVIEALQQAHAAAAGQPAVQAVAEGVDVEEREREEEAVAVGDLPHGQQVDGIGGEVVVRQDGAFRRAGRARGVDDRGGRIAVEVFDRTIVAIGSVSCGRSASVIVSRGSASSVMCAISRSR